MRSIGLCELLIELMMARSAERSAFGRTIIQYDTVQRWIAESRVELEQARLLAYRCAWRLDQTGHHGAWRDVSLIKVAVPAMLQRIADRAMQVFGAMGGSDDTPDPSGAGLGTLACGSATGRTRFICGRSSGWRRCRPGQSPIRRISLRIRSELRVCTKTRSMEWDILSSSWPGLTRLSTSFLL